MHSGIVNEYQLLLDAYTVMEQHRGTAALFLFYSLSSLSSFPAFSICDSHSVSTISFEGCFDSLFTI